MLYNPLPRTHPPSWPAPAPPQTLSQPLPGPPDPTRADLPFDGALLSRPDPSGGPLPQYGAIAWLGRDSTKPGRPRVAGGAGEAWVLHGGPGWSNDRAAAAPEAVARELLGELAKLAQVRTCFSAVLQGRFKVLLGLLGNHLLEMQHCVFGLLA